MNPIPAEIVESTRQKIADYTLEQGEQLANRFSAEQPAVMSYLMTANQDILDESERELLLYTGAVVWQMMTQGDEPLPVITLEKLQEAELANKRFVEPINNLKDSDLVIVIRTLVPMYKQPELLRYVARALTQAVKDNEVRSDNIGSLMFYLKTVIDCLNGIVGSGIVK